MFVTDEDQNQMGFEARYRMVPNSIMMNLNEPMSSHSSQRPAPRATVK